MNWLIRLSIQSVGLKVIRFALGIGTSILLTHLMTQHDYGIYAYVLVVATLLAIPGEAGIPNLMMREITRARVDDDAPRIRGLMVFSNLTVLSLTLAMATGTGLFLWFSQGRISQEFAIALAVVFPAILLGSLANTRAGIQRALSDPILSQLPEQVVRPISIGLFGIAMYLLMGRHLSALNGVIGYVLASSCAFIVGTFLLRRTYKRNVGSGPAAYRTRDWAKSLLPFSAIAGLQVALAQTSAFILGMHAPPTEMALFRVASLGSDFAFFSMFAISTITTPKFAEHHHRDEQKAMQELIGQTNLLNILFAAAVFLAIVTVGPLALRIGFGPQYAGSWTPMAILAAGALGGVTMSNVTTLANMSGRERLTIYSAIFGFGLNIVLSLILCPRYGVVGAASAAAITAVAWRAVCAFLLYRSSGLRAWHLELGPTRAFLARSKLGKLFDGRRIGYVHDNDMPAIQANTVNVAKMCDAFANNDRKPLLIHVGKGNGRQIKEYYGLTRAPRSIGLSLKLFQNPRALGWAAALIFRLAGVASVYGRKPQLLLPAAKLGLPVVLEGHDSLTESQPRSRAAFQALLDSGKLAKIVVISQALADDFASQWPQCADLLFVAHDGADAMPEALRRTVKPGLGFDRPTVGYAGHLYPGKGMEIIAALSQRRPEVDFLILGGAPDDIAYWRETLDGQTNVRLMGMVPHKEVPSYLAGCSVVLAPYARVVRVSDGKTDVSRWMSPLKMFEYMAQGLPIVASNLPVLREVLEHGRTAWLCEPDDIDEWDRAIVALLANPELGLRLGEAARLTLEARYTWNERARSILNEVFAADTGED